jgi:hypothetical protein
METFVELLMLKKEDHRNPLGFAKKTPSRSPEKGPSPLIVVV